MQGIGGWCEMRLLGHRMPNCSLLPFSPISKVSSESARARDEMAKWRSKGAMLDYIGIVSIRMRRLAVFSPIIGLALTDGSKIGRVVCVILPWRRRHAPARAVGGANHDQGLRRQWLG